MKKETKQLILIKQECYYSGCIKCVSDIYETLSHIKESDKELFVNIMLDVLLKYKNKMQNEKHIKFINHFNEQNNKI